MKCLLAGFNIDIENKYNLLYEYCKVYKKDFEIEDFRMIVDEIDLQFARSSAKYEHSNGYFLRKQSLSSGCLFFVKLLVGKYM